MPAFYLSCLLAFTSGHMFNYTVIRYLQEEVGAPALAGLGFALCFGPPLVFGWFAGALCDRISPLRLIHAAQALFIAGLDLLLWADRTIAVAAERAPLLLLAAAMAGIACFALASLLVLPLRIPRLERVVDTHVLEDIRAGFRAVQSEPLLAQLLLASILTYTMMGPMQLVAAAAPGARPTAARGSRARQFPRPDRGGPDDRRHRHAAAGQAPASRPQHICRPGLGRPAVCIAGDDAQHRDGLAPSIAAAGLLLICAALVAALLMPQLRRAAR